MRFSDFEHVVPSLFDLGFVRQALAIPANSPKQEQYLRLQVHRWVEAGRLNRLRNGLYELASTPPTPYEVANRLIEPSYITGVWVLSYYGLIPDAVMEIGSATYKRPGVSVIENHHGRFTYKQNHVFMGFSEVAINDDTSCYMASPEKALVDHWHFSRGEWCVDRHREFRYQNLSTISLALVEKWAATFDKPRLMRAAENFSIVAAEVIAEESAMITLEEFTKRLGVKQ